ncbi:MAG TPA: TerB family tellurite resistance protein, partial [Longimicrobiales bacterium]|nr:TerB family tellurite resistance protein [Longimicrobiales bacterium]
IREFFQSRMSHPEDPDPGVRKRDLRLAACALLLELAYADDDFTEDERQHLRSAIRRQWALDHHQADELIRMAERQRARAVDLWQFTSLIKQHYTLGQKMVLAETMWGLVYSDGELARQEDYLMRKICKLLDLKPGYLAEARKRVEGEDEPADEEHLPVD